MMKSAKPHRAPWVYLAWASPGLIAYGIRILLSASPSFTERWIANGLFRWISRMISTVTGLFPISMTEFAAVLAIPTLVLLIVLFLTKLIKRKGLRFVILRSVSLVLIGTVSISYALFLLLHGFNYLREPLEISTGLTTVERSAAELSKTTSDLLDLCILTRAQSAEDGKGVMMLPDGIGATLSRIYEGYERSDDVFPVLSGPRIQPKPVLLSHLWSYTGIMGMYFPFFVEANINIDIPAMSIPATAAHEIAHTRGFAREDEANFIAFVTCIRHPSAEVRYSGFVLAFTNCLGALAGRDSKAAAAISERIPDSMRRDFAASNAYWKQFEGPVREVSTRTNDAYLKANDQIDGIQSYGRMVDLVLSYYSPHTAKP